MALTPAGARELVQRGHEVVVETGAGLGSAFQDADYEATGARIASVDEVWEQADLLLKVKEPIAPEYPRLREGLVLFTYLHIAADEPLTRALVESGIAAVAYETVETDDRRLPLLAPMSEVAGRLAAQAGAHYLEKPKGGRGLLLGGVAGCRPGKVVDHRRRDRRLQRRRDRARARRAGDDPRALGRPDAPPGGDPARPRQPRHVLDARDRELHRGRRRRDRRRPDPRRARAEAAHPRDGDRDAGGRRLLRRRDRPGRLRRDLARDDARRSGLRRRRGHPLLRREHARRRSGHLDEGAHERDAALRRGDRRPRPCRLPSPAIQRSRAASTCSTGGSPTRRSPRRTTSTTRRSTTCSRRRPPRSRPSSRRAASGSSTGSA